MFTILAPILAQVVTVGVADRSEARVIDNGATYLEAATYPAVGLGFAEKRFQLQLGYSPTLTVTPLDSKPRQYLLLHNLSQVASYAWRRTSVSETQTLSFGEQNFRVFATSGALPAVGGTGVPAVGGVTPPPTTGTPAPGTGVPVSAPGSATNPTLSRDNDTVDILNYSAAIAVNHAVSQAISWSTTAGYNIFGGSNAASRARLPTVQGPAASASVRDQLSGADNVSSSLTLQFSASSNGNHTWLSTLTAGWAHAFNVMTSAQASAGLSGARASRPDGYVAYSIYPTFGVGVMHVRPLHPGSLSLSLNASAAPALDFETLVVDPRVGFGGTAGFTRDKFFASMNVGTSYSISAQNSAAFSGVSAGAGLGYRIATPVSIDGGVRVAWQNYERRAALPWTYVAYIGLSVALSDEL